MDMNCSDEQNNEDKVLMLMNVVLVKSDIIQNKTDSMKYILKTCCANTRGTATEVNWDANGETL